IAYGKPNLTECQAGCYIGKYREWQPGQPARLLGISVPSRAETINHRVFFRPFVLERRDCRAKRRTSRRVYLATHSQVAAGLIPTTSTNSQGAWKRGVAGTSREIRRNVTEIRTNLCWNQPYGQTTSKADRPNFVSTQKIYLP